MANSKTTDASGDTRGAVDRAAADAHLRQVDARLGELIDRTGPFRPEPRAEPDVFHALMRAIVYQQLSGKAAATIHQRLIAALGAGANPGPKSVIAASSERLRGAGLSANKEQALRGLAQATQAGDVPTQGTLAGYSDEALIAAFSALRGIGRWTVEMLLMFQLERPDVLPVHDLGVRKGFAVTYGWSALPAPRELTVRGELWRPYRSVAAWYMWRATEISDWSSR